MSEERRCRRERPGRSHTNRRRTGTQTRSGRRQGTRDTPTVRVRTYTQSSGHPDPPSFRRAPTTCDPQGPTRFSRGATLRPHCALSKNRLEVLSLSVCSLVVEAPSRCPRRGEGTRGVDQTPRAFSSSTPAPRPRGVSPLLSCTQFPTHDGVGGRIGTGPSGPR